MQRPETPIEQRIEALPPLSVVFCITELDPGGAEKALVRFAKGIHQAGWPVHVVSLRNSGVLSHELEGAGIDVTALNCGGPADLRAVSRLAALLRQLKPEILVCFLHQANIVGRIAGWLAGVQKVVSGVRVADRRRTVSWSEWVTQQLTSHYFAVSRNVADVHSQLCGIPPAKFSVLYNGVDLPDSASLSKRRSDGVFTVIFVGRLTEQKRPLDLVHAVAALPPDLLSRTAVDMLGEGELRDAVQNAITSAELNDRIRLHGHQADLSPWWAQADLLVLPSAWEGLPNVVLEAMARHVSVVATSVDGTTEVVSDGETGWLVEPGDVRGLSDAIVTAEASPEGRQQIADRAFEAVRQRFCWQSAIEQFASELSELHAGSSDTEKH